MDATDRQLLIERLQRENDEARKRIAERQAAREADPYSELERLMADTRDASDVVYTERAADGQGDAPVLKSAEPDILYRRYDGNASAGAPEPDWSAWEAWLAGHLNNLRDEMVDGFAEGMVKFFGQKRHEIDRELAVLRNENAELRGMLGTVLTRLGQTDEKVKAVINDLNSEHKDHAAQISGFETALAELRGRVSAILRDWTT